MVRVILSILIAEYDWFNIQSILYMVNKMTIMDKDYALENKINFIKTIRSISRREYVTLIGLREAKELVEYTLSDYDQVLKFKVEADAAWLLFQQVVERPILVPEDWMPNVSIQEAEAFCQVYDTLLSMKPEQIKSRKVPTFSAMLLIRNDIRDKLDL